MPGNGSREWYQTWIGNLGRKFVSGFERSRQIRRPRSTRYRVEELERRIVPAAVSTAAAITQLSSVAASTSVSQKTVTLVVDSSQDVADGNYSKGHLSLREAVQLANASSSPVIITFDSGVIRQISLNQVGDSSSGNSALAITGNVTIQASSGLPIILSGPGSSADLRLFRVLSGGSLTLNGLTISNWSSDSSGGALMIDGGCTATMVNCNFTNNSAVSAGGAIYNTGTVLCTNCRFSSNSAHDGGAYNGGAPANGGDANFVNCNFSYNTAVDRGGAVALYNSSAEFLNSTLDFNRAHQGGAIAGGSLTLNQTNLIGNSAIDGGGIYSTIGSGSTDYGLVMVGATGGPSEISIENCLIQGNTAQHRGGGLYYVGVGGTIENSTISGNHAQRGGGIYNDSSEDGSLNEAQLSVLCKQTLIAFNRADDVGGGIFSNNGPISVDECTLTGNTAQEGAALFNNLGDASVSNSSVAKNSNRLGTQLFNHLGILQLSATWMEDAAKMKYLSVTTSDGSQYAVANPGIEPSSVSPPKGTTIKTGADGIRWALTVSGLLLRQIPGCNWAILDDEVTSYQLASDGTCCWLNARGELFRSRYGSAGDPLGQAVQAYVMDQHGTIYDLSNGTGPGNFASYASLTNPLVAPFEPSSVTFANAPSVPQMIQAMGLGGASTHIHAIVSEPVVDTFDAPQYFLNKGWAILHRAEFKVTFYYDTDLSGSLTAIGYFDSDHLQKWVPGQTTTATSNLTVTPQVQSASPSLSLATPAIAYDLSNSDKVFSIWTGPDSTIYKLGDDYNGYHSLGVSDGPLVFWQMRPGGYWQPLFRAYSAIVAPNNTIYALNADHQLVQRLAGSSTWTTLATNIQSFTRSTSGTLYALGQNGFLWSRGSGDKSWTAIDVGVKSYTITPDGFLLELNGKGQLQQLAPNGTWQVTDQGVKSLLTGANGSVYELNNQGQLKQRDSHGKWTIIATSIVDIAMDQGNVLYALNNNHELKTRTTAGHWDPVASQVQSFILAPSGLGIAYVLKTNHDLMQLAAGYSWTLLQSDIQSMSINSDGLVTAYDSKHQSWYFWSPALASVLDPVEGEGPLFPQDPPSPQLVLTLLGIPDDGQFHNVVVEATIAQFDATRTFNNLAELTNARLYNVQYVATVYYTSNGKSQTAVLTIGDDFLVRTSNV